MTSIEILDAEEARALASMIALASAALNMEVVQTEMCFRLANDSIVTLGRERTIALLSRVYQAARDLGVPVTDLECEHCSCNTPVCCWCSQLKPLSRDGGLHVVQ